MEGERERDRLVKTKDMLVAGGARKTGEAECGSVGSEGRDRWERDRETQTEGWDGGKAHGARHRAEEGGERENKETQRERRGREGERDKAREGEIW